MSVRSRTAAPGTVLAVKAFGGQQNEPPGMAQAASVTSQMTMDHPFSPGEPVGPYDGYGRHTRQFDFTTGYNIATRPRSHERVSFDTLRGLIDSYDFAQICIYHRIDSLRSLDWKLVSAEWYSGDIADAVTTGMAALKKPDRINSFETWFAKWMFDVLAYDAGALYRLRNRAGRCVGLQPVDGTLIAPLLDYWGNPPQEPAEAYVQYVNGLPWNWLTRGDLVYEPFRPRSNSPYGHAPLEIILLNANTDIRFQLYFLQRFTAGNIPEAFASAPEGWDPTQIEKFQAFWDSMLYGDQARKNQIRWIPGGAKIAWSNEKDFTDDFSLFLMRKTGAAYHVVPSDMGFTECYSEDTECLTDRGWLRYDELQDDDRVAAYNPQTRGIEYHVPTHKYIAPYEGDMVHFKTRSVDVLVTPHHRMWAWTQSKDRNPAARPWREIRAEDLATKSRFGFVGHAVHDAPDIDDFLLPAVATKGPGQPDRRIPMDLWLEFLGYMISEGCVHRQNGSKHYNVSLSQSNTANGEKVERFTRCLQQLPISWSVADLERDGCRNWQVGDKSLWTWLVENIGQGSRGKRLPDLFRQLGKRQATILLDALLLGDGTIDLRECSTGREYGTMSAQLASDVQEMTCKLGYRVSSTCNGIGFWRVNITDGRDNQLGHQHVTRMRYSGIVWCVEVPHHLFVTRRNGKITVQGNTVNLASSESQADVGHRVGDLPLGHYAERILTSFLQDDLGLPLDFQFDWGEEQDDRLNQAESDQIYIQNAVVSASEIREMRFGLAEPEGQVVPRIFFTAREGPIPLNALYGVSGKIDPATAAPDPGTPLPHEVFTTVQGVIPDPPLTATPLAAEEYGPKAIPPAPPMQPQAEPKATDAAHQVAKEGETAGVTSGTGVYGYDGPGEDDEDDDERGAAVAKELAAFRRFSRSRQRAGTWRDFRFGRVDAGTARALNAEGQQAVAKAVSAGSGRDPKAWPGWTLDGPVTAYWAAQMASAATAVLPRQRLAELAAAWLASDPPADGSKRERDQAAAGWLADQGVTIDLSAISAGMLADAFAAGAVSAAALVNGTSPDASAPGDTSAADDLAADLGLSDSLGAIVGAAGGAAASMQAGYLGALGKALTDGQDAGMAAPAIAASMSGVVSDQDRAASLAADQVTAASGQAAQAYYGTAEVGEVVWLTESVNPCPVCQANADEGPVQTGTPFSSGDTSAPIHPNCACAVVPA